MKIRAHLLSFAAAAVLAANVWAADSPPPPIKIGVAGALSGDLASYGQPTARAAELAAEQINAAGGINGAKIELLIEDDACKPEVAANTAAKLVSAGVKLVIGHICSSATKAALPVYTDADVTVISPSATDSDLTESGKYPTFYRTIAPNNAQAKTIVDFVIALLHDKQIKRIAIIHDKGDYGKGLAEDAQAIIKKIRRGDYLARYGGEEFVIVLPDTKRPRAMELAERLKQELENLSITTRDNETIKVTASFCKNAQYFGMRKRLDCIIDINAWQECLQHTVLL